jgi:hypothetical protein
MIVPTPLELGRQCAVEDRHREVVQDAGDRV